MSVIRVTGLQQEPCLFEIYYSRTPKTLPRPSACGYNRVGAGGPSTAGSLLDIPDPHRGDSPSSAFTAIWFDVEGARPRRALYHFPPTGINA